MRHSTDESGFTLVEVVVALVVCGLLLTIIMPAALRAKERLDLATAREAAIPLAAAVLARRQAQAEPARLAQGRQGDLTWVSREAIVLEDPRGFFQLVSLSVEIRDRTDRILFKASTRILRKRAPQR